MEEANVLKEIKEEPVQQLKEIKEEPVKQVTPKVSEDPNQNIIRELPSWNIEPPIEIKRGQE